MRLARMSAQRIRNFHAVETQWIDGHAVCFQPSLRDGGGCCDTDFRGLKSTATLDRRYATSIRASSSLPQAPSRRPAQRKRLCVLRVLGENTAVRIGVCVPFAPLAPLALIGSKDWVAALLPCIVCGEKSGTSMPWNFRIRSWSPWHSHHPPPKIPAGQQNATMQGLTPLRRLLRISKNNQANPPPPGGCAGQTHPNPPIHLTQKTREAQRERKRRSEQPTGCRP
jgi:hypothetical protein